MPPAGMSDAPQPPRRLGEEHRTLVGDSWEDAAAITAPGQAHWGDPSLGKTCRECAWWDTRRELPTGHKAAFPRGAGGVLFPMKCAMAARMMFKTWGVPRCRTTPSLAGISPRRNFRRPRALTRGADV